jgi:Ni/Fe-hydrogenase subunit HybB-like protein
MAINVFFVLMELFTALYSNIPDHVSHFRYLFLGLDGKTRLVPWTWASSVLAVASLALLIIPRTRRNHVTLGAACAAVFVSLWIEKGLDLIVTGFIPNPLGAVTEYWPTFPEAMIAVGVYGIGIMIITVLYKIALSVRGEVSR